MNFRLSAAAMICGGVFAMVIGAVAQEDSWARIDDPDEVRRLVSNVVADGKYWKFYFRSDGKMAYEQGGFTSFREWKVSPEGEICMSIYAMPEKILSCQTIQRSRDEPVRYRMRQKDHVTADVQLVEPDQAIVDALNEKAGPVE